ncbi:MAG: hypothetical protein MZV63_46990 [Marinilabiliales bacterium]|nr:hypothetical protein [Marinilabiliales bacterium]
MGYHSPYQDISNALISRASDGKMTDVLGDRSRARGFQGRRGDVHLDVRAGDAKGRPPVRDENRRPPFPRLPDGQGRLGKNLDLSGPDGRFAPLRDDLCRSIRRAVRIHVSPSAEIRSHRPDGPSGSTSPAKNGGSRDWFMMFPTELTSWVRAGGEEALIRDKDGGRQSIRLEISHIAPAARAEVTVAGKALRQDLVLGYNRFQVPADAVSGAGRASPSK